MLLSRVLGTVGRFCIGLGALTLLFVAYQLWGTGVLTAQAQAGLEDDFESLLSEVEQVDTELVRSIEAGNDDAATSDGGDDADTEADAAALQAAEEAERLAAKELELLSNLLWQDAGEPVAKIDIPDIDLSWTVVEGVGTEELRDGPGHYPGTPLPGMAGNASIAGHRTTWGAPFNRIDELEPGDDITVRTLQGVFTYRVVAQETGKGHFIVSPDRVDVLDQDFEDHPNRLTLTACHPKFSARQRIIVVAELISEPAITVPRPDNLAPPAASLASEDVGGGDSSGSADGGLPGDPDLDDGDPADDDEGPTEDDAAADVEESAGDGESDDPSGDGSAVAVSTDNGGPSQSLQGTSESDTFGEGLNGNSDAIVPAIIWGLTAAVIAGTTGFIARRWRKWPSYVVAVTPFAVVLFVCFVHIDQALPSY
jgi:sortase A